MTADTCRTLREERFQRVLDSVESDMKARQKKALLSPEIWTLMRDIDFIRDQLEVVDSHAAESRKKVAELEPEVAALRRQTGLLTDERNAISGWEDLEELEKSLADKIRSLPRMEAEIPHLEREIKLLEAKCAEREAQLERQLARSRSALAETEALRANLDSLEAEIQVVMSTRDIIGGLVPTDIDPEVMESIQGDMGETLKAYISDVQSDIEMITANTERLNTELEQLRQQRGGLLERKKVLAKQVGSMLGGKLDEESVESLTEEVDRLNAAKSVATGQLKEALQDMEALRRTKSELDETLQGLQSGLDRAAETRSFLDAAKATLSDGEDVEAATARLRAETVALDEESGFVSAMVRVGQGLVKDVSRFNTRLRSACEDVLPVVTEFDGLAKQISRTG